VSTVSRCKVSTQHPTSSARHVQDSGLRAIYLPLILAGFAQVKPFVVAAATPTWLPPQVASGRQRAADVNYVMNHMHQNQHVLARLGPSQLALGQQRTAAAAVTSAMQQLWQYIAGSGDRHAAHIASCSCLD
jgi:hypothetical protein